MVLKYYTDIKYAPLFDLLIKASIKTNNQLMAFYDSSLKYCIDTERGTGEYNIFYQGGPIDHGTHVTGPVSKSNEESEYNAECTTGMDLANFRMLIHEILNKYTYLVPEESPIIILYRKYVLCMANNGKETKYTRHIYRGVHFVRNGEK